MQKGTMRYFDSPPQPDRRRRKLKWSSWLLVLVAALSLSMMVFPAPVAAQTSISVTATSVKVDYPASITFNIQAQSTSNITKLAVRYKLDRQTCVTNIVSEAWPDFTPSTKVSTSWVWQMKKTGGLPPGARLTYSWLVVDANGQSLETPWAPASFDDSRFPWRNVSDGMITLYWYNGDQNFANALLSAGTDALKKAAQDTGAKLSRPASIYIYASTDALQSARIFAPTWEGGVAFPDYAIIGIGVPTSQLAWGKTTVAHELTHVLTFQLTRNCYGDIPTWLNEGLSTYAEGPLDPSQQARLQRAVTNDGLFSVRTLTGAFSAVTEDALLSYAESFSMVNYLLTKYGGAKMLAFEAAFKDGLTQDEALNKVYGLDANKLDSDWRASVGAPPRPATAPTTPSPTAVPPTIVLTPAPTPSPTAATTPQPASTPEHRGFFGCRNPASGSVPGGKPDWSAGLIVFGIAVGGASAFGWIRRGRR